MNPQAPLSAILRQALEVVSSIPPAKPDIFGSPACPVAGRITGQDGVYGSGLHRHSCLEMCFVTDGACRVWGRDGFAALSRGELLVIPPDTLHAEGWCVPETPYRLLWLVASHDTAEAFTDTYRPGEGWTLGGRVFAPDTGCESVHEALGRLAAGSGGDETPARFLLKGGLLTMLARLLGLAADTEAGKGEQEHGADLAEAVCRHLDLYYADALSVGAVAARFGRSANHLNRIFSKRHGKGIHAYLSERRLEVANRLLKQHDMMVKEAAYRVGFTDPLHFCRLYKQRFGFAPSETLSACVSAGD